MPSTISIAALRVPARPLTHSSPALLLTLAKGDEGVQPREELADTSLLAKRGCGDFDSREGIPVKTLTEVSDAI